MATIAVQLRGATRSEDMQTFLDVLRALGFETDHPVNVQLNGTVEATITASDVAETLEAQEE